MVTILALLLTLPLPASAGHDPPDYTDQQIQDLIDYAFARLPSLAPQEDEPVVTGDESVDERIWDIAYGRGYELQPSAADEDLVFSHGVWMQSTAAEAWEALAGAAANAGHDIVITSGYRDLDEQREIFTSRLNGTSNASIDESLATAAPPGASRHHTGYAFDIREVDDPFGDFEATGSYDWLTVDNYHNAKRFGFLPSYPPNIIDAGPNPESWEWVYVGENVIFHDGPFWDVLPNHLFATSIEWMATTAITSGCSSDGGYFCPDLIVDRGQMAAFLRRAMDLPLVDTDYFGDDEESIFEGDIDAIAEVGITRGCNPPSNDRYCPGRKLDRGALAAFLARALDLPETSVDHFVDDRDSVFQNDINALASAGITKGCNPPANDRFCPLAEVTRGEMAAMLYRARLVLP